MKKSRVWIAFSLALLLLVAISIQAFVVAEEVKDCKHEYGAAVYTGENYHLGDYHYARFRKTCTKCGYSLLEWVPYRCTGIGGHVVPNALHPILTDK